MAASISTAAYCPGRRRSRCLHISSNANLTVESSFQKNEPDVNGSGKSRGLRGWLDRRYQLTPLVEFLRHKEVPIGSHWMGWYYLGGITMFFFVVQVVTGVLLLMYYQPGEATAYESIRFLTTKVPFGWLIRSVHSWSAHLMIISLTLHMFSTMMLKAYRPPREMTWVSGYLLFLAHVGLRFFRLSASLEQARLFRHTGGYQHRCSRCPVLGNWLLQVLRGGQDVTINTLYRFFAAHVVILPLAFVGVIALHLLLIQRQGMAPPLGARDRAARNEILSQLCPARRAVVAGLLDGAGSARGFPSVRAGDSGNGLGTGGKSRSARAGLSRDQTGMVFPVGVSIAEGISAAPLRSGRPAGLFVCRSRSCSASGRSFPGWIVARIRTNHRRPSAIWLGRRSCF